VVHPGERLAGDPDRARAALARWAAAEGDPDVARFVHAHFGDGGIDAVVARLAVGERVETCFDALAWLFPGIGAIGGGGAAEGPRDTEPGVPAGLTAPASMPPRSSFPGATMRRSSLVPASVPATRENVPPHKNPLRVTARALASVMISDGVVTTTDRGFVDRQLAAWGHPPLREDDLAVWRPHELGWPHDPGATIEAMARLCYVDGQRDLTEWRVVREFARAWGVSLEALEALGERLEREHQQGVRKLVSSISSIFLR
jgi:hypothetical protein